MGAHATGGGICALWDVAELLPAVSFGLAVLIVVDGAVGRIDSTALSVSFCIDWVH